MKNPPGATALDIHLPLLESLELRSCGFTCNDTLNWIIKHGSTLLSLKFDDCAIIYCMELAVTSKAEPNSVCISTENEGGRVYQRYWLRLDIWFQALAYGLPHLKRFDFGSSRVRALGEEGPKFKSEASEGPKFGRVNKFLFGLFPDRYLEMKDGSVRAPWILKTRGQRPYYKEPPWPTNLTLRCCAVSLNTLDRWFRRMISPAMPAAWTASSGGLKPDRDTAAAERFHCIDMLQ